ncbi:MAG: hypothetical protein ACOY4Y_08790 [Pseudomonadota bacterium]
MLREEPQTRSAPAELQRMMERFQTLPISARCGNAEALLRAAPEAERVAWLDALRAHLHPQALDMLLDRLHPLPGLPSALSANCQSAR